ncbi:MAG: hypothetical protein Q9202_003372 [Teloschistes flavicans]
MATSDESFMPDQEALKQMEDWIAKGEQSSEIDLATTQFDTPKENQQSTTEDDFFNQFFNEVGLDLSNNPSSLKDVNGLSQIEKSLNHTGDPSPFSSDYPPLDQLTVPAGPYFLNSQNSFTGTGGNDPPLSQNFTGLLQEQSVREDQDLWKSLFKGPSLHGSKTNQHLPLLTLFPGYQGVDGLGHSRPVLDNTTPAQLSKTFTSLTSTQCHQCPPALPIHSKPNIARSTGIQPSPTTNGNSTVIGDSILSVRPIQCGRKRKAKSPPIEDSSDDKSLPDCKRRVIEKTAANRAYMLGRPKPAGANHLRTKTIQQFNAANVYLRPGPPAGWSIFKYTLDGELEEGRQYRASEIKDYLFNHPLHWLSDGTYSPKKGSLRLWIQRNPADSARRYPSAYSNRCRFEKCFATYNVINQGHIRVCFDESQSYLDDDGAYHDRKADPFYCAGFVHLNCLERLLDFPSICATLPIMPDSRQLLYEPKGVNRMMLAPRSNVQVTESFINQCEEHCLVDYPKGARPHEGSLVWELMVNKVEKEPKWRKPRDKGGVLQDSHTFGHLGDLEVEARTRDLTRRLEYQVRKVRRGR